MPATSGAITHASPSRPRYGPSVPTFVVGFRPGGRIWSFLRATHPVYGAPAASAVRPFQVDQLAHGRSLGRT